MPSRKPKNPKHKESAVLGSRSLQTQFRFKTLKIKRRIFKKLRGLLLPRIGNSTGAKKGDQKRKRRCSEKYGWRRKKWRSRKKKVELGNEDGDGTSFGSEDGEKSANKKVKSGKGVIEPLFKLKEKGGFSNYKSKNQVNHLRRGKSVSIRPIVGDLSKTLALKSFPALQVIRSDRKSVIRRRKSGVRGALIGCKDRQGYGIRLFPGRAMSSVSVCENGLQFRNKV